MNKLTSYLYLFSISLYFSACKSNIYYIDSNKILQDYHGVKSQHELFQSKSQAWQQRVDSLGTELQVLSQAPIAIRAEKE